MGGMNTDHAAPEEIEALRAAFDVDDDGASALGWPAVHAFENEHGIVLPEPYRTFVAEVTDGSYAGPPDHGLVGLADHPDGEGTDEGRGQVLGRPFPLTEAWLWEDDPRPAEELEPILDQVFRHGSIVLGTDGCGMNWHLVVTGAHRGHIWNVTGEGANPFGAPFGHTTADPGFAGWVGHWAAGNSWYDAAE